MEVDSKSFQTRLCLNLLSKPYGVLRQQATSTFRLSITVVSSYYVTISMNRIMPRGIYMREEIKMYGSPDA